MTRPLYDGLSAVYGQPGNEGQLANLVSFSTPYPLKIAWDLTKTTSRITCHKLIKDDLEKAMKEILGYYGLPKIQELGIDLYGGCFNARAMRGSSKWSTHAWGISIDLDPARNTLKETSKTARFARPEYKPMIDIFEKYGFFNQGRYRDNDFMHFQACRYK